VQQRFDALGQPVQWGPTQQISWVWQEVKALQGDLVQQLGPVPLPPVIEALPLLSGVEPRPCLHLKPSPPQDVAQQGLIEATLRFAYGEHRGWWVGQGGTVVVEGKSGRVRLQRDPEAELEWMSLLLDLGFSNVRTGVFGVTGGGAQHTWLRWVDTDYAELRDAGFEVTTDDALQDWIRHADTLEVNLQHQGDDEATSPWFDLSLGIERGGDVLCQRYPGLAASGAVGAGHGGAQPGAGHQPSQGSVRGGIVSYPRQSRGLKMF